MRDIFVRTMLAGTSFWSTRTNRSVLEGRSKNVSRYIDGTFITFNGDVVSSLDLEKMLDLHEGRAGIGTMALWEVEDPSAFGVVGLDGTKIIKFQEKPSKEEACSNLINAGTYIFESDILDHIPDGVVSIEKQVFPNILDKGLLDIGSMVIGSIVGPERTF